MANLRFIIVATLIIAVSCDQQPRTWKVNLDLSPEQRWPWAEMLPLYNQSIFEAMGLIGDFIPWWGQDLVEDMALDVLPHLGEYAGEIRAASQALGVELSKITLLNIIYEVEAACTSIVAQDRFGFMLHARNLDFPLASVLQKLAIHAEFQKGGKTVFHGVTYVGYVGLLTGMRPNGFSISVDQRTSGYLIENLLEALFVDGTMTGSLLVRDTLQRNLSSNYEDALSNLSNVPLAAPIYFILGGVTAGQGAIITRDRNYAVDVWQLDVENGRWYEVETNWDHWLPSGDARRKTAEEGMNRIGETAISLDGMYNVLSTHPVLNSMTTYTALMSSHYGNFTVFIR